MPVDIEARPKLTEGTYLTPAVCARESPSHLSSFLVSQITDGYTKVSGVIYREGHSAVFRLSGVLCGTLVSGRVLVSRRVISPPPPTGRAGASDLL